MQKKLDISIWIIISIIGYFVLDPGGSAKLAWMAGFAAAVAAMAGKVGSAIAQHSRAGAQQQMMNKAWLKEVFLGEAIRQQQFAREDTAFSRATTDLKRAGLSPTLAAGSPSPGYSTSATPKHQVAEQPDYGKLMEGISQMGMSSAFIEQSVIDKKVKEQKINVLKAQEGLIKGETGMLHAKYGGKWTREFQGIYNVMKNVKDKFGDKSKTYQEQAIKNGLMKIYEWMK